ncbi:MAG TPA: hypothetical protein VHM90_00660 [Phycisphaerae bacterium]|nr:hypothetical protein [Phycisphaerae bacterium]
MRRALSVLGLVSLSVLASCSDFSKRFDATVPPMTENPAAPVAGKWEGTWNSDNVSYWGHMQAIIVPTTITVQDKVQVQQYQATFELRFFELPVQSYTVTLNGAKLPDGRMHFEGKKDVGHYNGGIVRFDGFLTSDDDTFYCDYNSDKDCGTFKLRRIVQEYQ